MVEDDHEKPAVDGPWTTENVRFQVAKGSLSHLETMGFHPYLLQGVPYFYVFPQKSLGKPWKSLGKPFKKPWEIPQLSRLPGSAASAAPEMPLLQNEVVVL